MGGISGFNRDLKGQKRPAMQRSGGRTFQAEERVKKRGGGRT